MLSTTATFLALAASVAAKRTFAVNHFYGDGPLTSGRADPIINPGTFSSHTHTIQGGSNFALDMSDTQLLNSACTSSLVKNDLSNYWTPSLFFQHSNGSFESVPMFYMNVYYFFEDTNDDIKAFQPGHRMVVGDPTLRTPPYTSRSILDLNQGAAQPVQWTCPRDNYNAPAWPKNSDGLHGAGIQDPNNQGAGVGFPDVDCNGYASPLRADIHFPSCYNPAVGLRNYKENMQFPSSKGTPGGKADCPAGWIHVPHLFYEVYWNTPLFKDLWTQGQGKQPFVLANGDPTGYSLHADFISGWDVATLQQIIDNCDAGSSGMDKCPGLIGGLSDKSKSCKIPIPTPSNAKIAAVEVVEGIMDKLPGNNPVVGFGQAVIAPVASAVESVLAPIASVVAPLVGGKFVETDSKTTAAAVEAAPAVVTEAPAEVAAPAVAAPAAVEDEATVTTTNQQNVVVTVTRTITRYPVAESTSGAITPSIEGFSYKGCFSDERKNRVLTGKTFVAIGNHQVTSTACVSYCSAKGFSIAGTEWGGECFCGDDLGSHSAEIDESHCNMTCEGDAGQICGGSLALSVYEKLGASKRNTRKARHMHRHAHAHHS